MKGKTKTAIVFFTFGAVATCLAVGVVCYTSRESDRLFKKSDFENLEMFVHKYSHKPFEDIAVNDDKFYDDVVALLVQAEKFRPGVTSEMVLGIPKFNGLFFRHDNKSVITVSFGDEKLQLSTDYIFRESPIISVGKSKIDSNGVITNYESWRCYLPAENYARLLELILRYTG